MKTGKNKFILIGAVAAVAVVAIIGIVIAVTKKKPKDPLNEVYREIKVYQLEGSASVDRGSVGKLDAYENMQLQNEDTVSVREKSALYLKMDEDKYGMLSENSVMKLNATGTSVDSKTKLYLEEGTLTCHIKNKLSKDSSFEVNTPNSTMAIRGTSFRVEVWRDENGDVYTKLTVFEGKIEVRLVFPDGTIAKDSVMVEKGTEIIIHMNDEISEYLGQSDEINYDPIEREELEFLYIYDGEDIYSIPKDELEEIIHSAIVTFTYDGRLFGTQRVRLGNTPEIPSMQPAPTGKWDYDFSKAVEDDIEIKWME